VEQLRTFLSESTQHRFLAEERKKPKNIPILPDLNGDPSLIEKALRSPN
jgi:hypothetical protein